jgi:hypothetical protein
MILELSWSGLISDLPMFLPASHRGRNIFGIEGFSHSIAPTGLTLIVGFPRAVASGCAPSLDNQLLTLVSTRDLTEQPTVILGPTRPVK